MLHTSRTSLPRMAFLRFESVRRLITLSAAIASLSCGGDDPTAPREPLPDNTPVLTSLSPEDVPVGVPGVTVTLTGTNFVPGSSVAFNSGVPGRNFAPLVGSRSATQLSVTVPSSALEVAGSYQVMVVNPSPGGSSQTRTFTVRAPIPTLTTLSHSTVQAGSLSDTLLLDGTGFYSESMVMLSGAIRAAALVTPIRLRVVLGPNDLNTVRSYDVAVLNPSPGGGVSSSRRLDVIAGVPTLIGLPSEGGTAGQGSFSIAVDGANFVKGSIVQWNGADRPTSFRTPTRLVATISAADAASPGVARINVRTPGTTEASTSVDFTLRVAAPPAIISQLAVDLPANDVVYDSHARFLYASIPSTHGTHGNSVVAIDPETGQVTKSVFVGSEPTQLAISDNGEFLYVSLEGSSTVRRVHLASFVPDLEITLGTGLIAENILVVPGTSRSIVVGKTRPGWFPGHQGVFVYDDGVQRGTSANHTGSTSIAFSGRSATLLYGYNNNSTGYEFTTLAIDARGIREIRMVRELIASFSVRIVGANGRLYGTNGGIVDPELLTRTGSFSGSQLAGTTAVYPDPALGRVFFLSDGVISAFDMNTLRSLGTINAPGTINEDPWTTRLRLVRWGPDGLAYRDGMKVYILRTTLAAR